MPNPYRVPLNWDVNKAPLNTPCHVLLCDGEDVVPSVCFKTDSDGWLFQYCCVPVLHSSYHVVAWCECVVTPESEQRAMDVWQSKLSEYF